ncbi:PUA-like domain-containing protein [Zychaea mexicana]|uniref:PUA-like domain-containing protein n=1 Tax=Zychaea mexicana TaxID=64656 RepID=UPI0022FE329F|nr:PUA-like domain-containing protein [Zychaea mexicana]KAI9489982.1 PUA-like domain-containing protein [Zychaea mexicana]
MSEMTELEGPQPGFQIKEDHVVFNFASGRDRRKTNALPIRASVQEQTAIFKKHIVGAIPTVPVGFTTTNKKQLASIGIHRAIQAGIDGSVEIGKVFSIVMSGGYEEDEDRGEAIVYTGSGGRDKTTGQQTFDQKLEGRNMLLAKCCATRVDAANGADAGENWRNGVPIRVVRGVKSSKHDTSNYAPGEGYRYDGIYKVESYWPSTGYTGHRVWRYLLRRDDRAPAPWSLPNGRRLMKQVAPRVFREADFNKRSDYMITFHSVLALWKLHPGFTEGTARPYPGATKKRDKEDFNVDLEIPENVIFKPRGKLLEAIHHDKMNMRVWQRLFTRSYQIATGIRDLMSFCEVALTQMEFLCLLCKSSGKPRDPLVIPLVHHNCYHCLHCDHNFCRTCIDRFKNRGIKSCPNCLRADPLYNCTTLKAVFQSMNVPLAR